MGQGDALRDSDAYEKSGSPQTPTWRGEVHMSGSGAWSSARVGGGASELTSSSRSVPSVGGGVCALPPRPALFVGVAFADLVAATTP